MSKMCTRRVASLMLILLLASTCQVDAWWIFSPNQQQAPVRAQAEFNMDGVKGVFKFSQMNPSEPTSVEYDLHGLQENNKLYHVHVRPVPPFDPEQVKGNAEMLKSLCSDPSTGGHLNPHNITVKLPPKSATLDKYELGDFSGKHGPLRKMDGASHHGAGHAEDHYQGSFVDDKISLKGEHGIIGRSIVVHKNGGARWVCANIVEVMSA